MVTVAIHRQIIFPVTQGGPYLHSIVYIHTLVLSLILCMFAVM